MSTDPLADAIHAAICEHALGSPKAPILRRAADSAAAAVHAYYRDAVPLSDERIAETLNGACGDTFGWREATPVVRALIVEATATADARIAELEAQASRVLDAYDALGDKALAATHRAEAAEDRALTLAHDNLRQIDAAEAAVADAQRHQANYNLAMKRAHEAEAKIAAVEAELDRAELVYGVHLDSLRAALGDAE